ncbi:ABC transporter permease [Vaginisenegalia massiliensis]|uniref:ABC transporter permease n=1 Tax=Vaginisenegalia massiliensis TaxID=2058294 RepID=UPI000F51D54B|nr:ABC transporter permease [Vaginisenegalia massiliensis]
MFLAWQELRYAKFKYSLVVGLIFLIAYLVFFLTSLAYGLAQDNRAAVDAWQADYVLLQKEANQTLALSNISFEQLDVVQADDKAGLTQQRTLLKVGKEEVNVNLFAIDETSFIRPKITDGRQVKADHEAVVDRSLAELYQVKLGQEYEIVAGQTKVKVVGFTDQGRFSVSPILYVRPNLFKKTLPTVKAGPQASTDLPINAIIVKGKVTELPTGLEKISVKRFIEKLPGYQAQVLTFGFMIGFLILIAALVLGIFIYILTIQKREMFGVLKAQGIRNNFLVGSVLWQTLLLSILGVGLGLGASLLSAFVLPAKVPYQIQPYFFAVIGLIMLVIPLFGALFSIRSIIKIDPLEAIG